MMHRRPERDLRPVPGVIFGLAGALATATIVALAAFTAPQPADALPAYAQQTGLACGRCHVNPAGGGARTAFGNAFAANGHKVPSKGAKSGKTNGGAPSSPSGATPPSSAPTASGFNGGYYSSAVNPTFGYVPELGYSNSVDFRIYPHSD
jgi:mono/diheme cytochrome c family protein